MCTTGLTLSPEQFASVVLSGYIEVIESRAVPGIEGVVDESEFLAAAHRACEPYCAGDREGAVQAIVEVLATHWRRERPRPETGQAALDEGEALLSWVERLAAARFPGLALPAATPAAQDGAVSVRGCSCGEGDLGAAGHDSD
jgi:hypothetical protein